MTCQCYYHRCLGLISTILKSTPSLPEPWSFNNLTSQPSPKASARALAPAGPELAAPATPNSTMDVFVLNSGGLDPNLRVVLMRIVLVPGLCCRRQTCMRLTSALPQHLLARVVEDKEAFVLSKVGASNEPS